MNYFICNYEIDIEGKFLELDDEGDYVLGTWNAAGVDYQSTIIWRYFDTVLKQLASSGPITSVNSGFPLCSSKLIKEVVDLLD